MQLTQGYEGKRRELGNAIGGGRLAQGRGVVMGTGRAHAVGEGDVALCGATVTYRPGVEWPGGGRHCLTCWQESGLT